MAVKLLFYLLFSLLTISKSGAQCTKSISNNNYYENYLGTKTPYRVVANFNSTEIQFEGCKATKFWSLVRHGTRNPNIKLIEKMRTRLPEIKDLILENIQEPTEYLRNSDLDLFRSWSSKLQDKDEKKLTHEGEDEMLLLAERMQNRFPGIFDNIYSETAFHFQFTSTQRTKRSAHYFAAGLFGKNTVKDIDFPEPLKLDPILRFYKLCNKWRREISKNPQALAERRKFENSDIIKKTVQEINERLGFEDELDFIDIHTMYMVCSFETAWNKRKRSPWCSVFTRDNLKVLEYAEDLKYYWIDGYGHELTYKQACPAFNNILDFFQNKNRYPKATVYFTHSGTLLKMLAHMQLYKDTKPLLSDDFEENHNRKWRVSQIDSFGTNLAFILFNCNNQKKVLTMHQEQIVRLPSCQDSDLCEFAKFQKYYSDSIECSFDEMCDNS